MHSIFSSLARFLVALFFILIGIIGLLIPLSPLIRTHIVMFILENSITVFLFSVSLLLIGMGMMAYIFVGSKRDHFTLHIDNEQSRINIAVIQAYLENYWKRLFPSVDVHHRLIIKKKGILIHAEFPYLPRNEQKQFLEQMKEELAEIFFSTLGYPYNLEVSASFQTDPGTKA